MKGISTFLADAAFIGTASRIRRSGSGATAGDGDKFGGQAMKRLFRNHQPSMRDYLTLGIFVAIYLAIAGFVMMPHGPAAATGAAISAE